MAVYDKSGYSHSETSLVAVIYVSSQVRPPRLPPAPTRGPKQMRPSSPSTLPGPNSQPPVTRPPSPQDKIVISQDEVITNNGDTKWLPYATRTSSAPPQHPGPHEPAPKAGRLLRPPIPSGNITVFRQTSTHLQMVTTFGLELVIQLWPLFQVYITVGPQFRGQTRGESLPRLPRPCPAQPLQKRRGPAEPCTDPGCRALTA